MRPFQTALAVGVTLALVAAGATVAQQSPPANANRPAAPRAATAPPSAPAAAAPAAAAQPAAPAAAAQPAEGQPVRTETITYGNWTVTCREVGSQPKRNCSATMQAIDQNRKQAILTWIIGHTPEGALATVLQTPTGVQIQRGVELKIGDTTPRKLTYVNCDQQHCESTSPMDAVFVRDASATQNATAVIVAKNGQTVNINFNLTGFDKAAAALTKG